MAVKRCNIIILQLTCALAACSTPATRIEVKEVRVPVPIQPLRPDQVPTPPAPLPKRPESLSAAADVLLSRWCAAVAYILRADPLLRLSAGEKQAELPAYPECSGE
jgi:hypothetical protein